jgi:uncharacterized protein (TIGR03435 family)
MHKMLFSSRRMISTAGLAGVAAFLLLGSTTATRSWARVLQAQQSASPAYVYEVASIKPDKSGNGMVRIANTPEGFTANNVSVQMLIRVAYGVEENQIQGLNMLVSENYDVEAKMEKSVADDLQKLDQDQRVEERRHMLQALLADRFKLTIHRETKELPIYALVVAKNGPKLQEAKPGDTYPNGFRGPGGRGGRGMMMMGRGELTGQGLHVADLARQLSQQLGRTVVDKTALTGLYDFTLKWTPDNQMAMPGGPGDGGRGSDSGASADTSGPSIFTAIQEQLGLKLESQKGPVEVLVIDHVEKPSEN